MRIRTALLAALPAIILIGVPLAAHATGIPFFGPIVPDAKNGNGITDVTTCAAGWAALAQVVNNIIAFVITLLILIVTPFMIAWAGFLYVFSPSNPSMRSRANSILTNTAIGIFFALAAWLIVDTLLTSLTSPAKGVNDFTKALFNGGDWCLPINTTQLNQAQTEQQLSAGGTASITAGQACASHGGTSSDPEASLSTNGSALCADGTTQSTSVQNSSTLSADQACGGHGGADATGETSVSGQAYACNDGQTVCATAGATVANDCQGASVTDSLQNGGGNGCDPSIVSSAASSGGYPLSSAQSNTLACISKGEDSCGSGPVTNYNWGKGSSAAGAYQVTLQSNSTCYDNSVCESAGGTPGTPLNCATGFSGGNPKTDAASQATVNKCLQAAANVQCSAASAACLVTKNPSFSDWAPYSSSNQACVTKYNI